ncbi:hypothetical protein V1512DRAFT_240974 [Lipomyces arxii]|uniref:mitochondrial 54S ribosomal protein uL22m n=1 Tax=Lipomyces arxii TaxID=56418 RepID=UPI0034CDDB50
MNSLNRLCVSLRHSVLVSSQRPVVGLFQLNSARSISRTSILSASKKPDFQTNKESAKEDETDRDLEEQDSLFDSIAPRTGENSKLFEAMDMSVERGELEARRTQTPEALEIEQLNKRIDELNVKDSMAKVDSDVEAETQLSIKKPEDDEMLMSKIKPKAVPALSAYMGRLRQAVYLRQNTGKEDPLIQGRQFKLRLSPKEQQLLEPSVWVKSYTQKGSVKKVTPFLRSLRGMTIQKAIAHCHFNSKAIARDTEKLLYRALDEAKELGLRSQGLYIAQCWSGKEARAQAVIAKMPDYKGRGRQGVLSRQEHHVQIVLKTLETKKRIAAEKEAKLRRKAVPVALVNKPIYRKAGANYLW